MRAVLAAAIVVAMLRPAHAEVTDHDRAVDTALIAGMGTAYLVVEFVFKRQLAAINCRWCNPNAFDLDARDALLWRDADLANDLGNLTGYVLAPAVAGGLLVAATWRDRDWRRWFDDLAPVYESAIAVSLLQHVSKFAFARQRPFVHFAPPGRVFDDNDNTSTWSGHTSLAFSLAVSAGVVADDRGYAIAPAVWIAGLTLGAVTGYLRIAADRHYATDVLIGAVMGTAVGYLWPRVHRKLFGDAVIAPTGNGIAIAGAF